MFAGVKGKFGNNKQLVGTFTSSHFSLLNNKSHIICLVARFSKVYYKTANSNEFKVLFKDFCV